MRSDLFRKHLRKSVRRREEKSSREASHNFTVNLELSAKVAHFFLESPPHKRGYTAVFLWVAILDVLAYLAEVQRLYSSYPSGVPGVALILLRLSVAILLLFAGGNSRLVFFSSNLSLFFVMAIATALCVGGGTELAAFFSLVVQALVLIRSPQESIVLGATSIALSLSTAMLGGGYYSVDGLVYGRKRVILPSSHKQCR
jgi:hypothetical protein